MNESQWTDAWNLIAAGMDEDAPIGVVCGLTPWAVALIREARSQLLGKGLRFLS